MGSDDPAWNLHRFQWDAWVVDFKASFCTHDQAQDALTWIGQLQQGSKSIMDYCTAFFKLKGRLGQADADSKYVKDCFWKGLTATSMEALVNMDFTTAEEARDILLRWESRLADIAAQQKGTWHPGHATASTASNAASHP
ncbi:hypothetical protein C0993_007108 [Termitomyces sp. T159_Od127]|nr:hypothetical protein C0993_007108 [Termitomyces sp. T159_Od127]